MAKKKAAARKKGKVKDLPASKKRAGKVKAGAVGNTVGGALRGTTIGASSKGGG